MIAGPLRSLLAEPAVTDPPVRVWRDWVAAAAIVVGSVIEVIVRDDLPWPAPTFVVSLVLASAMFFRRTHRLPTLLVTFGLVNALSIAVRVADGSVAGFYSMAFVLAVLYSVFRWGSGREMFVAVLVALGAWVVGITTDPGTIGEAIGGMLVLACTAGAGLEVRQLRSRRERMLDRVRYAEREQLARELHDSVAHHVSAIAIQAQAGQAVAGRRPEAAVEALAVIEEAASRTLAEMRAMVGALRNDGDDAELAPQQGVADIPGLAGARPAGPPVAVRFDGDLDDLRPSIDAALYRLAQESVTNATRHAVGATSVDVCVHGDAEFVRLTVVDDGRPVAWTGEVAGYGLVGMQERVKLLGGALSAGPAPDGGWRVDAVLPRTGATS